MPLDRAAVKRGCRGAKVLDRPPALPRRARQVPRGGRRRRAADRRLHAGGAAVCRNRREAPTSPTPISARPRAGRRTPAPQARRWRRCSRPRAEPTPETPFVSFTSEGVVLIYGRDEQAIEAAQSAQGSSRRHRADQAARRRHAAAGDRLPGGEGHDPFGQGSSRRLRAHGRRLCAAGAVVARHARFCGIPRRRGVALRPRARSLRRCAAVHRIGPARRLSARRSRRWRRRAQGRARGARPRRHLRQAALCRLRAPTSALIRDRASSAAPAVSISARPARSPRRATTSRSMRISARAAANVPPFARPARHPTRCPRRMR